MFPSKEQPDKSGQPESSGTSELDGRASSLCAGERQLARARPVGVQIVVDLTKRQKEIFDFINRYLGKNGYPPTVREIGKAIGLHSPSTVHAHLGKLEGLGLLRRDPTKPRAIEVLVDRAKRVVRSGYPLVGTVAAGQPVLAEENIEEYLDLPAAIGGESGDYVLRVKGDSMRDAGILGGDHVVVRPADDASDGDIIVALIEDEATVKRFFREAGAIRLEPENPEFEPIVSSEVELLGRVVGVFRKV